jgi:hypothetical protein
LQPHGCAGNAEHRAPNKSRLTYLHTNTWKPTDEWRRIKTLEQRLCGRTVELAPSCASPNASLAIRARSLAISNGGALQHEKSGTQVDRQRAVPLRAKVWALSARHALALASQ